MKNSLLHLTQKLPLHKDEKSKYLQGLKKLLDVWFIDETAKTLTNPDDILLIIPYQKVAYSHSG